MTAPGITGAPPPLIVVHGGVDMELSGESFAALAAAAAAGGHALEDGADGLTRAGTVESDGAVVAAAWGAGQFSEPQGAQMAVLAVDGGTGEIGAAHGGSSFPVVAGRAGDARWVTARSIGGTAPPEPSRGPRTGGEDARVHR